ncbi:MAG: hypothetical protein KC561_11965, partial [Myxococcales bacterium]|nr:hypothetical protein [Myxococcales bacterium]
VGLAAVFGYQLSGAPDAQTAYAFDQIVAQHESEQTHFAELSGPLEVGDVVNDGLGPMLVMTGLAADQSYRAVECSRVGIVESCRWSANGLDYLVLGNVAELDGQERVMLTWPESRALTRFALNLP